MQPLIERVSRHIRKSVANVDFVWDLKNKKRVRISPGKRSQASEIASQGPIKRKKVDRSKTKDEIS